MERVMDRAEAKDIINYDIRQYIKQCEDATDEDFEALDLAIEALSDPHNCAGCKYEEMWSEACEKCSGPMVDNYVKEKEENKHG